MASSSRDTSPDPLNLPSSPLQARSTRKGSQRPSMPRTHASPSKSVVLDTPTARGGSPWRIKVTVEAEPKDGVLSSRKSARSALPLPPIPSSPTKRVEGGIMLREPRRKRKGTPITRPPARESVVEEEDEAMPAPSHSPQPRTSRVTRRGAGASSATRTKRLSIAREELDHALQEALQPGGRPVSRGGPGDVTVSRNEDFSMISVESLHAAARETSMSHVLGAIPEGDKSGASVSFLPSSPPKVLYPNLGEQASAAKRSGEAEGYDVMSWKPTGRAEESEMAERTSTTSGTRRTTTRLSHVRTTTRQAASQNTATSRHQRLQENTRPAITNPEDDDIWHEEASRSIASSSSEADHPLHITQPPVHSIKKIGDIFSDQAPLKPPRAKIPRTWRRSSGADFAYADSPAHPHVQEVEAVAGRHSGGSQDGSGVLTPPSTDDDEHQTHVRVEDEEDVQDQVDEDEEEEEGESELTNPDGEATRYDRGGDEAASGGDATTPEEGGDGDDDSGSFFFNNLPQVYRQERPRARARPPRQTTVDLADLLELGKSSPAKKAPQSGGRTPGTSAASRRLAETRAKYGRVQDSPSERAKTTNAVDTPLRKSLLKSSKVRGGGPVTFLGGEEVVGGAAVRAGRDGGAQGEAEAEEEGEITLREMGTEGYKREQWKRYHGGRQAYVEDEMEEDGVQVQDEHYDEEAEEDEVQEENDFDEHADAEETRPPVQHSYEERLNLDSPRKIHVNFNDSSLNAFEKKKFPSLFDAPDAGSAQGFSSSSSLADHTASSSTRTLASKRPTAPPALTLQSNANASTNPNILTRLTTNFWSAVTRPASQPSASQHTGATTSSSDSTAAATLFPPTTRIRLRTRYGVCAATHPWTLQHMRTLHRMLNSALTKPDTLIPLSGPLPTALANIIATKQVSISGHSFMFEEVHARVVFAFLQVLVDSSVVAAMEEGEVEWLGDELAGECRGWFDSRHGGECVWGEEGVVEGRQIGVGFVVRAIGDAVWANLVAEGR